MLTLRRDLRGNMWDTREAEREGGMGILRVREKRNRCSFIGGVYASMVQRRCEREPCNNIRICMYTFTYSGKTVCNPPCGCKRVSASEFRVRVSTLCVCVLLYTLNLYNIKQWGI